MYSIRRTKEFVVQLSYQDLIDVKIIKEKGEIVGVVLNLRCKINEIWHVVYRVDTAHGYLHEQRFWIGKEPIELPMFKGISMQYIFNYFMNRIKQNFGRFRKYYEEKVK